MVGKGENPSYQHFFSFSKNVFLKDFNCRHGVNVTHNAKRDLIGIAKSIEPGQAARSARTDHGQIFSLLADFMCIKW